MKLACALVVVTSVATTASAHVRDPYSVAIHVRDSQRFIAGTTFGLLVTDDGGATWRWTCEQGLHYQDPFDPDYAYAPDGAILEQTSASTWLKRDLCGDDTSPFTTDISGVEASPDGALFATAYDGTIYKAASSTASFVPITSPAQVVQWTSLEVAPGDAQRVYLVGFRSPTPGTKEHVLVKSTTGGTSWTAMSATGFPTGSTSLLHVVGTGPAADTLYVYSPYEADDSAAIYRSINAGASWTKIFSSPDPYKLAFLVRSNGELVVAGRTSGAQRSTDGGTTWQPLPNAPHISALAELPDGEVWAGTQSRRFLQPQNLELPAIEADGFLLMHSSDLATWKPGVSLAQILPPTTCAVGSPVREACADMRYDLGTAWCCLVSEYALESTELDCRGGSWCGGFQDAGTGGDLTPPPDRGCCDAGTAGNTTPIAAILLILLRRGRTRVRRAVGRGQRR